MPTELMHGQAVKQINVMALFQGGLARAGLL